MKTIIYIVATIALSISAVAQVPRTMNYQGILANDDGGLVPDGDYIMNFKLYDALDGGNLLWSEQQTINLRQGILNAILGKISPLNIPFDKPYWLGISIEGEQELNPRIELTASPYSLKSASNEDDQLVRALNGATGEISVLGGGSTTVSTSNDTIRIKTDVPIQNSLASASGDADSVFFIDSLGNIGIGTNKPKHAIHFKRDTSFARMLLEAKGGFILGLGTNSYIENENFFGIVASAGHMWFGPSNNKLNNVSSTLVINRDNHVGINERDPIAPLHIGSRDNAADLHTTGRGMIRFVRNDSGRMRQWLAIDHDEIQTYSYYQVPDPGSTLYLQRDQSPFLPRNVDMVNGTLYVKHDSTVGIGTRNPDATLHVYGRSDPTLKIQSNGTNEISGRVSLRQSNNTGADIYYNGTSAVEALVVETFDANGSKAKPLVISNEGELTVTGGINGMPMPTAYGTTTTNAGSKNWNASKVSGGWNIEFSGEDFDDTKWTVSIQPHDSEPLVAVIGTVIVGGKKLLSVRLFDLQSNPQDSDVSFIVYEP